MAPIEIWLCVSALGAKLSKDGNQWSFLWGENLQEGIAGFGDTIQEAALDFYRSVCNETISEHACGDNYEQAAEEYESLPKIPGWIARDKDGCLCMHFEKPQNNGIEYLSNCYQILDTNQYPNVTWESGPLEIELLIRKV